MYFDGKRISKENFINMLDEVLPAKEKYQHIADSLIKDLSMHEFETRGGSSRCTIPPRYSEACFCVMTSCKEYDIFRYFVVRCYRNGEDYLCEITRTIYKNGDLQFDLRKGRYYTGHYEYNYITPNDHFKWKDKHNSYYDHNSIYLNWLEMDNCPRLQYVYWFLFTYYRYSANYKIEACYRRYMKQPKYEILWKCGVDETVDCIDKLSNKQLAFMGKNKLSLSGEVLLAFERYDVEFIKRFEHPNALPAILNVFNKHNISKWDFARFVERIGKIDCSIYKDYLDNIMQLKLELKDWLFTKNYEEEHDRMAFQIQYLKQDKECKKYETPYKKIVPALLQFECKGEYTALIPHTIEDFLKEATAQKICLFSNKYYKTMMEGKCLILFIRKNDKLDKSYVTVELNRDFSVVQIRAYKNTKPSEDVINYVNNLSKEWQMKYKELPIPFIKNLEVNYAGAVQ